MSPHSTAYPDNDKADIHRLRNEYEKGIDTNENLKRRLEIQLEAVTQREQNLQNTLRESFNDNFKSSTDAEGVKLELMKATSKNESLAMQVEDLHHSIKQLTNTGLETQRLRSELQEAHGLNHSISQQLKELRDSMAELPLVKRELAQSKTMNEQLGKQLADVLNHMETLKTQNDK